jgi:hypothetical protein
MNFVIRCPFRFYYLLLAHLMKKLTHLTILAIASWCSCLAQRSPEMLDSAMNPHLRQVGDSSIVRFSANIRESNKVWLQWDMDSAVEGDYFIVERSQDGVHYENIASLETSPSRSHYELTDQAPPNGADFYRIHYTGQSGRSQYSKAMELSLSGEVDFKFYPNPVDKLFIVRTEHMIDLEIVDPEGVVRLSKRLQPGIQVVNAAALERGVYVLRVTDKESNRAISSQLVKN